jgi:hypothetical protein
MIKEVSKPNQILFNGQKFSLPYADLVRPLTADEEKCLRDDIAGRGVVTPIIVSELNEVIDGANRLRLATELKQANLPLEIKRGLSADEKRALAVDLNAHRRQLSRADMRKLIERRLRADPAQSNNAIATELKVDDKTVASHRKKLESTSEIPKSAKRVGRDGRARAAKAKSSADVQTINPQPIVNQEPHDEQPGLFPTEEVQPQDPQKSQERVQKPHPWWVGLKDFRDQLYRYFDELRRLAKLKVAERSPSDIELLISRLRRLASEMEDLMSGSVKAKSS